MKHCGSIVAFGAAFCGFVTSTSAQELSYFLPKGSILAGYQWRIEKCPTDGDPTVLVVHKASIKGQYSKGQLVRLNPRSGFLASRSVKLTFHENGTLKTINAEGEGKAGAIVTSILKTAVGLAGFAFTQSSSDPRLVAACHPEIRSKVDEWRVLSDRVDQMEARIAAGETLTGLQKSLYESYLKDKAELEKALTLTVSAPAYPLTPRAGASTATDPAIPRAPEPRPAPTPDTTVVKSVIPAPDFSKWFSGDSDDLVDTAKRFCARYTTKLEDMQASSPSTAVTADFSNLQNRFVYLNPVPVKVEVIARPGLAETANPCENIPAKPEIADKADIALPQLSKYFALPIGAGAFESKSVAAEFTAEGRIVSLSYSSSASGTGIAEALAGGLAAAEALRDSDVAATKRRIEEIKAENELEALLEAAEDADEAQ